MTSIADVVHTALSAALFQAMGADQYNKLVAEGVLRSAASNAALALAGDPVALLMTAVDALDSATSVWISKFESGSNRRIAIDVNCATKADAEQAANVLGLALEERGPLDGKEWTHGERWADGLHLSVGSGPVSAGG